MTISDDIRRIREQLNEIQNGKVRVAFFGQPGAGKSSLINAIVGKDVAEVDVRTDTTVDLKVYPHDGLELCDLPGFGTERFPKAGYWERFKLDEMDLFLCVFSGKLHAADVELFNTVRNKGKTTLLVRTKADTLWQRGKTDAQLQDDIRADVAKLLPNVNAPMVFTSCNTSKGIDDLQRMVMDHLEPAKGERWMRSAKFHSKELLDAKKEACRKEVSLAAAVSAMNALNPIPGVDLAVDFATLIALNERLKAHYGVDNDKLNALKAAMPYAAPLVEKLIKFGTKEGIVLLLKRFAGQQVGKQLAKYVPFVGTAIAAAIGYGVTLAAGNEMLDTCHEAAEKLMEKALKEAA